MVAQTEEVWQRCCDPYGRQYYHNQTTSQTVWETPVGTNLRIIDHPAMAQMAQQMAALQQPGMPAMFGGAMPGGMFGGAALGGGANDVDSFVAMNKLDASAASKLRGMAPHVRKAVMDRGDLKDARNPNAVLMGRIRDAEREAGGGSGMAMANFGPAISGFPPGSLDAFIAENRIDASAGDKLRALPPDVQKAVIDRGNLTDARNPNAMLMGRIRDATSGRS